MFVMAKVRIRLGDGEFLSQLCLNCVKSKYNYFANLQITIRYDQLPSQIRNKKNPAYGRNKVSRPMHIEAFFVKKTFFKRWQGVPPAEGGIPCRCASIALRKILAGP